MVALAPLVPESSRAEFMETLTSVFRPYDASIKKDQAEQLKEAMEEIKNKSYNIVRGPRGQTLVIKDNDEE